MYLFKISVPRDAVPGRECTKQQKDATKYGKSLKLLYTLENFVTFTLTSFCEEGEDGEE